MSLTSLEPESSASANSAISANHEYYYIIEIRICQHFFARFFKKLFSPENGFTKPFFRIFSEENQKKREEFFQKNSLFFLYVLFLFGRLLAALALLVRSSLGAFLHAVAEAADLFAGSEIFPVHIGSQPALLHVQLAVAVQIFLVDVHADNLCQEHIVATQRHDALDLTFQINRALLNQRHADLIGRSRGQMTFGELIDIPTGAHTAPVCLTNQLGGGQIDDELAAPRYRSWAAGN